MEANFSRDPDDKDKDVKFIGWLLLVLLALILMTQLSGCKQIEYVTVPEYHTDTLIQTNVQKDSVYMHDSTYVMIKGDTVTIDRWHTKYISKEVHDTTYVAVHDSVPVPYPVKEYIEKPLTWWQKTRIYAGNILLIGLFVAAGFGIFKLLKKLKVL